MMWQQFRYMKHQITALLIRNSERLNMKYNVVEIFQSINGEGMKAGELAAFVRFKGCNLRCRYCDTMWANEADAAYTEMDEEEIIHAIKECQVKNVTVTGGEPLLQKGMDALLKRMVEEGFLVEIETNGSIPLEKFYAISKSISFTMDYKLAGSGMEQKMHTENFALLDKKDTVKFVVAQKEDLERAFAVAEKFSLNGACNILLSPVFDEIALEEIVEFMKEHHWTDARMQIQMHKVIWNPQERGV